MFISAPLLEGAEGPEDVWCALRRLLSSVLPRQPNSKVAVTRELHPCGRPRWKQLSQRMAVEAADLLTQLRNRHWHGGVSRSWVCGVALFHVDVCVDSGCVSCCG